MQHHRITPGLARALHGSASTQQLEATAAASLPPHTLMQRAGLALAQLARALAPHARTIWIACGPGNNGGDGLEAALHLHQHGQAHGVAVVVTWLGRPEHCPEDARRSWQRAQQAGVCFAPQPPDLGPADLCIDALLGVGLSDSGPSSSLSSAAGRTWPEGHPLLHTLAQVRTCAAPVLAVDLPSGLLADTGQFAAGLAPAPGASAASARYTLSLLTLKPGLFTGAGRDAAGSIWLDDLACPSPDTADAWLNARPSQPATRPHASHKGSFGDVAVVGGEGLHQRGMGMAGAAVLAARAALHSGAGRVLLCLHDSDSPTIDLVQPELMLRHLQALQLDQLTVVCGCGGGVAVHAVLPAVLAHSAQLVLDADALNAIAADPLLQEALQARKSHPHSTILTPHPLEAARLLGTDVAGVQAQRLQTAEQLSQRFGCVVVLKGSGTVIAAPEQPPRINPTGNGRLACAGTGDVLAGMIGACLAAGMSAHAAACHAVFAHGQAADHWPPNTPLTANALACQLMPLG